MKSFFKQDSLETAKYTRAVHPRMPHYTDMQQGKAFTDAES